MIRQRENTRVGSKPIYQGNVNETPNDRGTKTAFWNKWQRNVGRRRNPVVLVSALRRVFFFLRNGNNIRSVISFGWLYFIVWPQPGELQLPHPPSTAADRRRASWQLSTESVQLPDKRNISLLAPKDRLVLVGLHLNVIIVTFLASEGRRPWRLCECVSRNR